MMYIPKTETRVPHRKKQKALVGHSAQFTQSWILKKDNRALLSS